MNNRYKLIHTGIVRFKTRLTGRNKFILNKFIYKGDSRYEFKLTGFLCKISVTKNLESNHQVNKQKLHHQSISQMVIQ